MLDRVKGSHHIYYHPITKRRAIVPRHKKDLPKGTLFAILKQAGIGKDELSDLT
ncbi:MAG: type II toxin-antitoxin system HicA family toxin [Methanosarcinales archaeon]|nr:type II toxin-antitoxin system HicA family toxin [Methanosarcinales archaeon]